MFLWQDHTLLHGLVYPYEATQLKSCPKSNICSEESVGEHEGATAISSTISSSTTSEVLDQLNQATHPQT
jgi:hypothetical protein